MLSLSNGTVEIEASEDFGPRILSYRFLDGENILGQHPHAVITTELGDWKPWGGHRLWTAPESRPESYSPDNSPVKSERGDLSLRLVQAADPHTGIEKEIELKMGAQGTRVEVIHRITNRSPRAVEAAAWAITIVRSGGVGILPQEPYRSWEEYLLPARPVAVWHYTNLGDRRWRFTQKYIFLESAETEVSPQKIGVLNKQGWAAYHHGSTLFVKKFPYFQNAVYPDYGSNNEVYAAGPFFELESLGPLKRLEPEQGLEHTETWFLVRDFVLDANDGFNSLEILRLCAARDETAREDWKVDEASKESFPASDAPTY